jgi:hypothetical protein
MTTLSPGEAQQIADLGSCIDMVAASSGPPGVLNYQLVFRAAYNKMADIAGAPHAPVATVFLANSGQAMDWANKCRAAGAMTQQQFTSYIAAAFDELTASITET